MPRLVKSILKGILTDQELEKVYSSIDIIGEIAIIKIPESLIDKRYIIGKAILENIKHVRSVYMQRSPVDGIYRIRELECIAGIDDPITIYKEHGCIFKVNVKTTYFSPRLSTERIRLTSKVNDGEVIINMFGGVGTFSIIIAKRKNCKVYNIDINPEAYKYSIENVKLNKVEDKVIPILGDAREVIKKELVNKADRILMPLPEYAKEFIDYALMGLKGEGIIHYFTHVHANNKRESILRCKEEVSRLFQNSKVLDIRVVRDVGPRFYQLVADLYITRSS